MIITSTQPIMVVAAVSLPPLLSSGGVLAEKRYFSNIYGDIIESVTASCGKN